MNWTPLTFDWNHTRAFLVTAEEGSLSAAAKALNMTQPTLSRQVSALETALGLQLFERVGQRLILTQCGHRLLEKARLMGDTALGFALVAASQDTELTGKVTISCSELDAVFRLPKLVAQLRNSEPSIDIELVVTNKASDLKRREADIAIRGFRPDEPDLIARKLGGETIWLYGTQDYVENLPKSLSSAHPGSLQVISFEDTQTVASILNAKGWGLSMDNFQVTTSYQMSQLSLCQQGLGVIFLPEDIGDNDPQLKKAFPENGPVYTLSRWLVCHQELRTTPRIRRVYDYLADKLSCQT